MAEYFPDATKKADCISREAVKAKKVYSRERREFVVPVAEIDWLPAADINAILAENDTMRKQLAQIGKKTGDKMDDVRPVVRAHWIETAPINKETGVPFFVNKPHFKCSNCGSIDFPWNYCHNCGAVMKETITGK